MIRVRKASDPHVRERILGNFYGLLDSEHVEPMSDRCVIAPENLTRGRLGFETTVAYPYIHGQDPLRQKI